MIGHGARAEFRMPAHRSERDLHRGRCAAARVRAGGGSALASAYASIEATFSPAMRHSVFKDRVAALMRGGAAAPDVRMRYQRLVERHPVKSLDAAIVRIARLRDAERNVHAAAVANWGHSSRIRLNLMILDEVFLILRILRRYAPAHFADVMKDILHDGSASEVLEGAMADAAE